MAVPWEKAIHYGLTIRGAPYSRWQSGPLRDRAPAWAGTGSLPKHRRDELMETGTFCAGLVNLMLREVGGTVPQNPPWNGGTEAFGLAFKEKLHPFSIDDVRRGDAVFRPYFDVQDQGHIAIALGTGDDPVLQSFAWNSQTSEPGVNCDFTLRESHDSGYYTFIIKREDLWPLHNVLVLYHSPDSSLSIDIDRVLCYFSSFCEEKLFVLVTKWAKELRTVFPLIQLINHYRKTQKNRLLARSLDKSLNHSFTDTWLDKIGRINLNLD